MYKYAIIETMFNEDGLLGMQNILFMTNDLKQLFTYKNEKYLPEFEKEFGKYYYIKIEKEFPDTSITGCPLPPTFKIYCTHKNNGSLIIFYISTIIVEKED